jgi:hypothetical protein
MVSPCDWFVSSIWLLLSTGQVAFTNWGNSLPVHARWSELLLFLPDSSCVALQLQLCLVIPSPSKVGQFSFEYSPLSQETTSGIHYQPHFGRLAYHPTLVLSFCASPNICSVLALLGCWLVAPPPTLSLCCLSHIHSLRVRHWEFVSLPHSCSAFYPNLCCWC